MRSLLAPPYNAIRAFAKARDRARASHSFSHVFHYIWITRLRKQEKISEHVTWM